MAADKITRERQETLFDRFLDLANEKAELARKFEAQGEFFLSYTYRHRAEYFQQMADHMARPLADLQQEQEKRLANPSTFIAPLFKRDEGQSPEQKS